jgi:hypothetical protein
LLKGWEEEVEEEKVEEEEETSYGVAWSKVGKRRRSGARTSAALPLGSYMC